MTRKSDLLILLSLLVISSCTAADHDRMVMIPMRDGTKLSTIFVFPKTEQAKYPVVLVRSPYEKEIYRDYYHYLVDNGYVLALQDVRGRFGSEGKFEPFVNEGKDGYDAVEWIARQTWCHGNIGMIGSSYNGRVQYCAAVEKPPHLKTIIPSCSPVDLFRDTFYRNGVFVPYFLWWSKIIEEEKIRPLTEEMIRDISDEPWDKLLNHLPVSELDRRVLSERPEYYQEWVRNDSDDGYWKKSSCLQNLKDIEIPVFIQTGWLDTQLLGSKLAYNELSKSGNKNVKLIIGPWGHTDRESKYYRGKFLGNAAVNINLQEEYVRRFDYWLKGIKNGIMDEPMVQLYATISNKWYEGNTYPLKITTADRMYLSSAGEANLKTHGGSLIFSRKRIRTGFDKYSYDPGRVFVYNLDMMGKADSIKDVLNERNDYLFYERKPFSKETTLLGQLSATIFASGSALDTDWFLVLVSLDGNDNFTDIISFGMLRAKFRNSLSRPELLRKNKIYRLNIDLNQCGIALKKGEKVGLIITSSFGFPYFDRNLNTEKNQTGAAYKFAHQKIYHTIGYRSYITVPILNLDRQK